MEESSFKETRVALRRIQDHLFQAHAAFGVEHETVGFVDVIHHPNNRIPDLNYVTPRRNTAWVSGKFVQEGLDRLKALDRLPRVQYIEELYPPLFAKTLGDLGLAAESDTPLMVFVLNEASGTVPTLPKPTAPSGVRMELVTDQRGIELWRYVWRNDYYDLMSLGVEPLAAARDPQVQRPGQEIDILMHRQSFPVGVARLGLQTATKSAHIVALALLREARAPRLTQLLLAASMRAALARGCNLIFAPGVSEADHALSRELGFVDLGSMICYAAPSEKADETPEHDILLQPVLALRR